MKSVNVTIMTLFVTVLLCTFTSVAQQQKVTEKSAMPIKPLAELSVIDPLGVDQSLLNILKLLKLNKRDEKQIAFELTRLSSFKSSYNYAEQYLLLLAQALQALNHKNKHALSLLEKAKSLFANLSKEQLAQPEFSQIHRLLAKQYADLANYQSAYLEIEAYFKKHQEHNKNKYNKIITTLTNTYQIDKKNELNERLNTQNKLKALRIVQEQEQKSTRYYKLILIVFVSFLLILILFRMLTLRNRLLKYTRLDRLTGTLNRYTLFEQGHKLVHHFANKPANFTLLSLDLDGFKEIDATYGKQAGEQVLITCTRLINETMRSRDILAHIGAGEFVALLPFADINKSKAIAERINEKISHYSLSAYALDRQITISIGLATIAHNNMSFEELLHHGELAMFKAKEQGFNRVVRYQDIALKEERRGK